MQIKYSRYDCRNQEQDSNHAEIHKPPSRSRFRKSILPLKQIEEQVNNTLLEEWTTNVA
jgi:hypothetical protein